MGPNEIEFKLGFSGTSAHFRDNQLEGKCPARLEAFFMAISELLSALAVEFAVVGEFTELSFHRSNHPPP
jgi:hypothetical protein